LRIHMRAVIDSKCARNALDRVFVAVYTHRHLGFRPGL
jgi:hypothetical protein